MAFYPKPAAPVRRERDLIPDYARERRRFNSALAVLLAAAIALGLLGLYSDRPSAPVETNAGSSTRETVPVIPEAPRQTQTTPSVQ